MRVLIGTMGLTISFDTVKNLRSTATKFLEVQLK